MTLFSSVATLWKALWLWLFPPGYQGEIKPTRPWPEKPIPLSLRIGDRILFRAKYTPDEPFHLEEAQIIEFADSKRLIKVGRGSFLGAHRAIHWIRAASILTRIGGKETNEGPILAR